MQNCSVVAVLLLVALAASAVPAAVRAQSFHSFWGHADWNSTLVYEDRVQKPSTDCREVVEERVTYPPRGVVNDRRIIAIRAYDMNTDGNGAKATLAAGGLYDTTVTVLFQSQRGHSVNFQLEVYTKPCLG